jgi:sulfur transfer complex TusBCD TusB component (DsrH family)
MKVLQIITTAYRATIEEQDDTVVWITHAMRNAGGQLDVLLRGDAVNYAVAMQDASGLAFGEWRQTQPPRLAADLAGLLEKGAKVHLVAEDFADRGLGDVAVIDGIVRVGRKDLAKLWERYDQVWQW